VEFDLISSLEISRESYIDENLITHQSDILIRTRLRNSPLLVYILVEHKSYPYKWTLLKLLSYMVRIWEKEHAQHKRLKKLPPIIPMIFYHGSRRWRLPLDFVSYVEIGEELRSYIPSFQAVMFNLQQLGDVDLRGNLLFQAVIKTFKYALTQLGSYLGEILRNFSMVPFDDDHKALLNVLLEYIIQVGKDIDRKDVEEVLRTVGSADMKEAYMTLEEQLIAKGKDEGKLEGKLEGKVEGRLEGQTLAKQQVLLRLIEKKFGPVDIEESRKIRNCRDLDSLDQAIELVLDAESIDRVLEPLG